MATSHALASAPLMQIDSHKLPMTVMAVDDNPANLKLIGALLDDLVQQVILCDSGQQAVDKAKQLQMDLILMDIQMPDMDGIRACELIHHLSHHQQTPVIAVTAHALEGQREKLLSAGMNDYLAKQSKKRNCTHCCCAISPACTASFRRRYRPQSRSSIIIKRSTGSWRCARRP